MALQSGSPAIDAGNPSGCKDGQGHLLTTDQRGMPRHDPEDTGGCDMGALSPATANHFDRITTALRRLIHFLKKSAIFCGEYLKITE